MPGIGIGVSPIFRRFRNRVDVDLSAYLIAAGIPNDGTTIWTGITGADLWTHIGISIASLKSTGLWDLGLYLNFFPGASANGNKYNAFSPVDTDLSFRLTYNGTPTHNELGMVFDGVDDRADTHIIPVACGFEFISGMSFSFSSTTNDVDGQYVMGSYTNDYYYSEVGNQYIAHGALYDIYTVSTLMSGRHIINRPPSSNNVRYVKNGVLKEQKVKAFTYFGDSNFLLGAVLDGVTYYYCKPGTNIGFLWIGEGLTPTQEGQLNTIQNTYLTSIGRV